MKLFNFCVLRNSHTLHPITACSLFATITGWCLTAPGCSVVTLPSAVDILLPFLISMAELKKQVERICAIIDIRTEIHRGRVTPQLTFSMFLVYFQVFMYPSQPKPALSKSDLPGSVTPLLHPK